MLSDKFSKLIMTCDDPLDNKAQCKATPLEKNLNRMQEFAVSLLRSYIAAMSMFQKYSVLTLERVRL